MEINNNDELIEIIGEEFLWEIVGNYVETHLELLKEAMRPLGYIDYNDVQKITFAEVRESDEFIVNGFNAKDGILTVNYEMPAGILTENDDGSVCFHVTTWCSGTIDIPDINSFDWNSIDFDNANSRGYLLPYHNVLKKITGLVKRITLCYEEIEADDLNA